MAVRKKQKIFGRAHSEFNVVDMALDKHKFFFPLNLNVQFEKKCYFATIRNIFSEALIVSPI